MRQVSLLDSFLKKQKPMQPQILSNKRESKEQEEIGTAQKLNDSMSNDNNSILVRMKDVRIHSFDEELENKEKNNFKEIINGNDFAFEGYKTDFKKKRKMEIEDQHPAYTPKPQQEEAYQSMEEEHNDSSDNKPKRKVGRPQTSAKQNKKQEQAKIKRNTMGGNATLPAGQNSEEFTDVTPDWATPEGCKDSRGRRPNHPQYDPCTLFIPPEAQKGFTETMKQYWRIKSENFDKIILFKLGKFYEMFYEDAAIGNKFLDLKWMGSKMHVGFPEKCLDKYAHEFVQLGYKLVIVEQLQTPEQMKERMVRQRGEGKKTQKTLQRGVTQVLTKGTIVSFEDQNQYLPNYLIAVSKHNDLIGYSLLQIGVNMIMVGYAKNLEEFKTMLFQTRPVELLYDPDNLPQEIVEIMKQKWLQMVLTRLPNRDNVWHPMNSKNQIENLVNTGIFNYPAIFQSIQKVGGEIEKIILATLSGMFRYLKSCLKFDYIMSAVKFGLYEKQGSSMSMILDSQALQHLEIFQTPLGEKDSLFSKIDRTHTKFGKRLLRRWLMQPLLDQSKINQRLDAIEDLQNVSIDRNRVADIFSKLPDLQKIVNRLYHYSVKTIAQKAVYFEDVSSARLREFRELIDHFNKCWQGLQLLRKHKDKFQSQRLKRLITLESNQNGSNNQHQQDQNNEAGLLPSVRQYLAQFDEYIKWEGDIPRPQKGLVQSYDMLQDQLSDLKVKLQDYLDGIRGSTGISNLKYVHTKQRYQIQIPEQLQKKRLPQMIFTSKRSGYSRYVTEQSRRLVTDVEYVEQQIKEQMGLFVGYFFEEFRKNQKIWEKFISIIAQVDCLISVSLFSFQSGGVRPLFTQEGFDIIQAKHPCLNADDIIANNINLDSKVMLLTGPNMGGKSTLLRTTCLLVILAQMGSYVPADRYECEVIDRIFTRIGASDKLEEGKSTFFIEMQETKSVLTYGTNKSLAIIDQLGRGTSTFDGMAIAYSVLLDLIKRLQCRCIFATHYHSLSKQFQNLSAIKLKMMDYLLADDRIVFLYKLKDGRAEQSFGLNVAKVVKIPDSIINKAGERAKLMEEEITRKDKVKKLKEAIAFSSSHD